MQINNAGSNAYTYKPLSEASDEDLMYAIAAKLSCFVFPSTSMMWSFQSLSEKVLLLQRSCYNEHSGFDDLLPRGKKWFFILK